MRLRLRSRHRPHTPSIWNHTSRTRSQTSSNRSERSRRMKTRPGEPQNVLRNRDHPKNEEHHRQAEAGQRVQREEDHRSGHQDPEEGHQCLEEDHRGQAAVRQGQEEDHQGQGEDREEGRIARALRLASLPPCRALKSFAREERTLLRELTHRISNELVSSISIVSAAAVRADNPEVKVALSAPDNSRTLCY